MPFHSVYFVIIQVSTVVQFRTIDWGMEFCSLRIRLPNKESAAASNFTTTPGSKGNFIDVYSIPTNSIINLDKLSYRTRPTLGDKVARVKINDGADMDYRFACAMDSLHTFALTSGNANTGVEWWQDKQSESPGKDDLLLILILQ